MDIHELKARAEDALLAQDDVHAVGIGLDDAGNEAIVITVAPGSRDDVSLPQDLDGDRDRVIYRESAMFHPEVTHLPMETTDRRGRHRPVVPGVSAGHPNISAGTVGFQLTDGETVYTASNNHVYANVNRAEVGDPLYQPGVYDGGRSGDASATLAGYVPVGDGATVDLAWGQVAVDHTNTLAGVGAPQGAPRDPGLGDTLIKSGRTTGVTTGRVEQIDVAVAVDFGGVVYRMDDQVITEDMSEPGDSGSAALHADTHEPAGLLFAGSDTATIFNTITNVEAASGLHVVTGLETGEPTANVQFTLEREGDETGNISVIVYGSGGVIGGATVAIDGPTAADGATGPDGTVEFTDVPIGDYAITANADGYHPETVTVDAADFR